jgi:hypothetical protein
VRPGGVPLVRIDIGGDVAMSSRRIEAFLLRLVVDDRQVSDALPWRGRIQHVGSGHERHFEHLPDMMAFINEQLAARQSFTLSFEPLVGSE